MRIHAHMPCSAISAVCHFGNNCPSSWTAGCFLGARSRTPIGTVTFLSIDWSTPINLAYRNTSSPDQFILAAATPCCPRILPNLPRFYSRRGQEFYPFRFTYSIQGDPCNE